MMDGSNKRGRPHWEWSDDIEQWCGTTLQELSHAALDRQRWAAIVTMASDTNGYWAHGCRWWWWLWIMSGMVTMRARKLRTCPLLFITIIYLFTYFFVYLFVDSVCLTVCLTVNRRICSTWQICKTAAPSQRLCLNVERCESHFTTKSRQASAVFCSQSLTCTVLIVVDVFYVVACSENWNESAFFCDY